MNGPADEKPLYYRCRKCGEKKSGVRILLSHQHYCLDCCPVGREDVQVAIDFVRFARKHVTDLSYELRDARAMLEWRRKNLGALVEQGAQLTDEEWTLVGLQPDAAAKDGQDE